MRLVRYQAAGGPASSSLAVDVTPTGGARHTRIRAVALLAPLAAAALVMLVAALRAGAALGVGRSHAGG